MRAIVDIGEHSVFAPGLQRGGWVLDAGANRGAFGAAVAARFPVQVLHVEANPALAARLAEDGRRVVSCALGASDGSVAFNVGENDEASSIYLPRGAGAHLVVRETVTAPMRSLQSLLREAGLSRLACVKLDIEGAELAVLGQLGPAARTITPQWTVEFHDDEEFKLSRPVEVDEVIGTMRRAGFAVLKRNWPSRSNVLFVDRRALSLSWTRWAAIKFRYQHLAWLWRKLRGL
jgi:FkbM family methyltransferase